MLALLLVIVTDRNPNLSTLPLKCLRQHPWIPAIHTQHTLTSAHQMTNIPLRIQLIPSSSPSPPHPIKIQPQSRFIFPPPTLPLLPWRSSPSIAATWFDHSSGRSDPLMPRQTDSSGWSNGRRRSMRYAMRRAVNGSGSMRCSWERFYVWTRY